MAESVVVEVEAPGGAPLRVEWASDTVFARESGWRLDGVVDWERCETLRVLSAQLGAGRGVALAALRPAGAAGHGEESVGAVLVSDGAAERIAEALVSTEYGPDGLPRRVGLELYPSADAVPLRVAADVVEANRKTEETIERVSAPLLLRFAGAEGEGLYEILRPS